MLRRHSRLNPGKPLARGTGLARRTRLRWRSAKTVALYRTVRVPLVRELLADPPPCALTLPGCTGAADTVHELLPRGRGGSITDRANLAVACSSCNDGASNEHITEATARGLLRHSWDGSDAA